MAKRSQKGGASQLDFKRSRSSSATLEPHHSTRSLLQLWNIPSSSDHSSAAAHVSAPTGPSFESTSSVTSVSSFAQTPKPRVEETLAVENRHESKQRTLSRDGLSGQAGPTFSLIPNEVLEMVLCQVNIRDLYFSCRLVCKRWNDIVTKVHVLLHTATLQCWESWIDRFPQHIKLHPNTPKV